MSSIFSGTKHLLLSFVLISSLAGDKQSTARKAGLENVSASHGIRVSIASENFCVSYICVLMCPGLRPGLRCKMYLCFLLAENLPNIHLRGEWNRPSLQRVTVLPNTRHGKVPLPKPWKIWLAASRCEASQKGFKSQNNLINKTRPSLLNSMRSLKGYFYCVLMLN